MSTFKTCLGFMFGIAVFVFAGRQDLLKAHEREAEEYVIARLEGTIKIDGRLNEWGNVNGIAVDRTTQVTKGKDKWSGPEDLSGLIKVVLDNDNLYLSADITQRIFDGNQEIGSDSWKNDCIELFLEVCPLSKAESVGGRAVKSSGYDYQIYFNPGSAATKPRIWFTERQSGLATFDTRRIRGANGEEAKEGEVAVVPKPAGKGYFLEAKIPLANFGSCILTPRAMIGFDVAVDHAAQSGGNIIRMIWHGTEANSDNPELWGKACVYEKVSLAGKTKVADLPKVGITIWGDTRCEINGVSTVNRKMFGIGIWAMPFLNPYWAKYMCEASDGFGTITVDMDQINLPGLEGLSESAKKEKVFQDEYWKNLDIEKAYPEIQAFRELASHGAKDIYLLFDGSLSQFKRDSADTEQFTRYCTVEHPEFSKCYKEVLSPRFFENQIKIPFDKEVYAKVCTELFARIRALFSGGTKFYIGLWDEPCWLSFFCNQRILDDAMVNFAKYGGHRSGRLEAEEYLKVYNPLMKSIKKRFPDVLIGGPNIPDVSFNKTAGRIQWEDYIVPFLDGAEELDFFGFDYGNEPNRNHTLGQLLSWHTLKTRGRAIPLLDIASSQYIFYHNSYRGSATDKGPFEYSILNNYRVWFGYLLNHPQDIVGWCQYHGSLYLDGLGRLKPAGAAHHIFRNLRGTRVLAQSSDTTVQVVSAVFKDALNTVVFNDNPNSIEADLAIELPQGTSALTTGAELLWYSEDVQKVKIAGFAPVKSVGAGPLAVKLVLPPFASASVTVALNGEKQPSRSWTKKEYSGDNFWFMVEKGKASPEIPVSLPPEIFPMAGKKAALYVGYLGNISEAPVCINGLGRFNLPVPADIPGYRYIPGGKNGLAVFPIDATWLKEKNVVAFPSDGISNSYRVLFASIIIDDPAPSHVAPVRKTAEDSIVFRIDGIPKPVITGAPSTIEPEFVRLLPDEKPVEPKHVPALRGRWTFDDMEGDVVRDAGSCHNDGKMVGTGLRQVPGKLGKGLSFDGYSHVIVKDAPSLNFDADESFSMCAWIKTTAERRWQSVLSKMDSNAVYHIRQNAGNTLYGYLISGKSQSPFECSSKANDGEWHHVAVVRDVKKRLIIAYWDGEYNSAAVDMSTGDLRNSKPLYIGCWLGYAGNALGDCFRGVIDDVRLYGTALTLRQVRAIMEGKQVD